MTGSAGTRLTHGLILTGRDEAGLFDRDFSMGAFPAVHEDVRIDAAYTPGLQLDLIDVTGGTGTNGAVLGGDRPLVKSLDVLSPPSDGGARACTSCHGARDAYKDTRAGVHASLATITATRPQTRRSTPIQPWARPATYAMGLVATSPWRPFMLGRTDLRFALLLSLAACGGGTPETPTAAPAAPDGSAAAMPAMAAPRPAGMGKVVETMNVASYTYAQVQTCSGPGWIAGPETAVTVGQTISWTPGQDMAGFHSNSLDRTFEHIEFTAAIAVEPNDLDCSATGQAPAMLPMPAATPGAPTTPPVTPGQAPEATYSGPVGDVTSVAKVIAEAPAKVGQAVVVHGKVVKFSPAILGVNWIHLQDGSGKAEDKTNDLTLTSSATVAVGDEVTLSGTLGVNKDFGAGYTYAVIVENAALHVE